MAAAVFCTAAFASCGAPSPCHRDEPDEVLRYFFAAADAQRTDLVWECLSDESKEMLTHNAEQFNATTEQKRLPHQMIRFGHVISSTREYKKIEVVSKDAQQATINIVRHDESSFQMVLQKQHNQWTIGLPLAHQNQ